MVSRSVSGGLAAAAVGAAMLATPLPSASALTLAQPALAPAVAGAEVQRVWWDRWGVGTPTIPITGALLPPLLLPSPLLARRLGLCPLRLVLAETPGAILWNGIYGASRVPPLAQSLVVILCRRRAELLQDALPKPDAISLARFSDLQRDHHRDWLSQTCRPSRRGANQRPEPHPKTMPA